MDEFAGENLIYRFGDFELESGRRVLRLLPAGSVIALTPRAFDLLLEFVRRPQVLIGKADLIAALWPNTVVEDNNLEHTVSVLRQALGESRGAHQYIKTIHRRGYQFTAPVRCVTGQELAAAATAPQAVVPPAARRQWWPIGLASLVITGAVFSAWQLWSHAHSVKNPSAAIQSPEPIVAVLWFEAPQTEEGQLLGESVTYLIQERLTAVTALPVIAMDSIFTVHKTKMGAPEMTRRLHARYFVSGQVSRTGNHLHLTARVMRANSDAPLWSKTFDGPVTQITAIREDIARAVVESIHVDPRVASEAVKAPVDLDVYQLYRRGERSIGADASPSDTQKAAALFARTTALDPEFARGYLGIAQALLYDLDINATLSEKETVSMRVEAGRATDRALELNPALGRAWVQRGMVTADADQADRFFRRGMELAPNDSVNAMFYSNFLSAHGRMGEALAVVQRARKLDPISPLLYSLESNALMENHSDVAGSERLMNEVSEIDPKSVPGDFAFSRWRWQGRFADAIHGLEQDIKAGNGVHAIPAMMYLDVDDLPAAINMWNSWDAPPHPFLMIAQYQRNIADAASQARIILSSARLPMFGYAAEAIRDDALMRHDFAPGLALLDPVYHSHEWTVGGPIYYYGFAAVYAHMLFLSGEVARGRQLAKALLVRM
ncbi:MAG: winged helix-turn-helix domain-containing tetratricopeptide repeat protein, partial [Povalibacter sp.]